MNYILKTVYLLMVNIWDDSRCGILVKTKAMMKCRTPATMVFQDGVAMVEHPAQCCHHKARV